jgi:ubiquitin carboxyl-terminal hydrolase MINDY-1/2
VWCLAIEASTPAHLQVIIMSTSTPLTFSTKVVKFHGDSKRILLQNENGPCPLLAILNALILQGKLQLPAGSAKLNSSELQHQLVGHIVDRTSALGSAALGGDQHAHAANLQQQIDDTINLVMMGRFIEGMDVNLLFGDCSGFEYTREVCPCQFLHW